MSTTTSDATLRKRVCFLRRADVVRCTQGKFFVAEFVKKNGETRRIIARTGVHRHVTGKGLKFDPSDHAMIVVWDSQKKQYRMLNLSTLLWLRCGEYLWTRDESSGELQVR